MSSQRCGTCGFEPCRCEDLRDAFRPTTTTGNRRATVAGVGGQAGWPIESDSMGVHPSQVKEAYEQSVRLGVPTQFKKNGAAVIENAEHRRKLGKGLGMIDRNCFNW